MQGGAVPFWLGPATWGRSQGCQGASPPSSRDYARGWTEGRVRPALSALYPGGSCWTRKAITRRWAWGRTRPPRRSMPHTETRPSCCIRMCRSPATSTRSCGSRKPTRSCPTDCAAAPTIAWHGRDRSRQAVQAGPSISTRRGYGPGTIRRSTTSRRAFHPSRRPPKRSSCRCARRSSPGAASGWSWSRGSAAPSGG